MDKLRNKEFYYSNNILLQGQQRTAKAIDEWVEQQFINQLSAEDVKRGGENNEDRLRLKAMMGFLYKEAVKKLRDGYFELVGAVDTANKIDQWVNRELIKRMRIK